jgi:hypothetical protein
LSILGGLVVASGTVWAEKVSVDFNAKLNCQVPTLVDTTTKSRKISEEIDIEIKKIDFNKGKSGMPPAWGSMSNIFKFVNGVKYEGALISNRKDSVAFEFIEGASDSETYLAIYELRLPTLTGRRTVMKIFSNSNSLQVSEINCSRR